MAARTGAVLTSLTTTENERVPLKGGVPLSVTRIMTLVVMGPWASVGVQVKTPLVVMAAPAGALVSSENVSSWAGTSASVAVAVNVRSTPSLTIWLVMTARTGAEFD